MENTSIENIIKQFLTQTDLMDHDEIVLKQDAENPLFFSLHTKNSRILTGKDGETLHAITYLLKRIIEKTFGEETAKGVTLDINDVLKKRIDQLKTTAHMLAERARFFKSAVDVDPMNPFERRVIHEYLQGYKDLSTESTGTGKDRHIVIKYIDKPADEFSL